METYDASLQRIAQDLRDTGGAFMPPCSEEEIRKLITEAREALAAEIPRDYLDFLRRTNGLDYNGLVLYAAHPTAIPGLEDTFLEGFVDANLNQRDVEAVRGFLVFGESSLDVYVYNLAARQYEVRDRTSFTRPKVKPSFDQMIADALEEHL